MREPLVFETSLLVTKGKIYLGHSWWYFEDHNMSFLAPPKCGSSSIKQFIWMNELEDRVMNIQQREVKGRVCAVVRDPLDRFVSLWKSKCRDKEPIKLIRVHGMSPRELMEFIKRGKRDVHWTLQSEMIKGLDPELIPLPNLTEWWKKEGFGDLGNFNVTEGDVELDEDIVQWVREYFAKDFALYEQALSMYAL